MTRVRIGSRHVGEGAPVYVIAEAGSNHDGNLDQSLRLIDVAADAGADAVKFQTFRAEALYARQAGSSDYLGVDTPIYDVLHALEMPEAWIGTLADHCAARRIDFLSTPFDERAADLLDDYVPAFKVASYELTHHPLLAHVARKGKPVILSTGACDLAEIAVAVDVLRSAGCDQLVLMQCTAAYPAPLESLNLRTITTMREEFGVPVGLSDHSREPLAGPLAAVALGACAIEKHFTLKNDLPGPDHRFAVEPHELAEMIAGVRAVESALGSGLKDPAPIENELRRFARRSIFATRAISKDEMLDAGNLAVLRCGKLTPGLRPSDYPKLLGRRAAVDIEPDAVIHWGDVV